MKITQPVTFVCIITFQKNFIDFKSTQNTTLINTKACMLNIAHIHASVVSFSYFSLLYATKYNQSTVLIDTYYSYSMTAAVVLFAYPIKLIIIY